jgi:hypothetical protein
MRYLVLAITVALVAFGCAMKTKVMDVSMVSMTHPYLPEGSRLEDKGPVSGKFCADSFNDKGSVGLFDEAISAAQKEHDVDFITTASFFREGNCVSIEGNGQKIVSSNSASPMANPENKSSSKKRN